MKIKIKVKFKIIFLKIINNKKLHYKNSLKILILIINNKIINILFINQKIIIIQILIALIQELVKLLVFNNLLY
ncbi:hypothetical protein CCP3SC1AL1_680005 [Gammaproteobacteria bacterium]